MNYLLIVATIVISVFSVTGKIEAQLARKAGQLVVGKIFRETAEEAVELGSKQVLRKAAQELTEAGVKNGARSVSRSVIASGGRQLAGIAAKYGDDAAECLAKLTPKNTRRLGMLAEELEASGQAGGVWNLLAKGGRGDEIVDFLWRNKGTLAGGTLLAAFIAGPDRFLDPAGAATESVVHELGESVAKPVIAEAAGPLAHWIGFAIGILTLGLVGWSGMVIHQKTSKSKKAR